MSADDSDAVPLAIYPPGFDTNSLTIFSATPAEVDAARASVSHASMTAKAKGGDISPADSGGSSAASQSSPPAPLRPPTKPVLNSAGTVAIGWQLYNANGTNPVYASPLADGSGIPGEYVHIYNPQGLGANQSLPCPRFYNVDLTAIDFAEEMGKGGWQLNGLKHDNNLGLSDLQGSGTFFNQANIGLLILHGSYGTSYDYTTGRPLYGIYMAVASGSSAQFLRMTSMNLGGSSPTNGLKWMAIMACDSLYQRNWNSMISQRAQPYNSNLHMILGTATEFGADPLVGQYWAEYMLGDPSVGRKPMTVQDAWYNAAYNAYVAGAANGVAYPNPMTFAVVADPNCINDYLQTNSSPSGGTWQYSSWTVYPPGNPPPTQ